MSEEVEQINTVYIYIFFLQTDVRTPLGITNPRSTALNKRGHLEIHPYEAITINSVNIMILIVSTTLIKRFPFIIFLLRVYKSDSLSIFYKFLKVHMGHFQPT